MEVDEPRSPSPEMAPSCCILPQVYKRSWRKWLLTSVMFATCLLLFSNNGVPSLNKGRRFFFGDSKTNNVPRHMDLTALDHLMKRDVSNTEAEAIDGGGSLEVVTWKKPFSEKYKPMNKLSSSNFKESAERKVIRQDLQSVEQNKRMQERSNILGISKINNNDKTQELQQLPEGAKFQNKDLIDNLGVSQNDNPLNTNQEKHEAQQNTREKIKAILSSKAILSKKEKIAALEEEYAKRVKKMKEKDEANSFYGSNKNEMLQTSDFPEDREILIGSLDKQDDLNNKMSPFSSYGSNKRLSFDYSNEKLKKNKDFAAEADDDISSSKSKPSLGSLRSSSSTNNNIDVADSKRNKNIQNTFFSKNHLSTRDTYPDSKTKNAPGNTMETRELLLNSSSLSKDSGSTLTKEAIARKEKLKLLLNQAKAKRMKEKKERQENIKKLLVLKLKEKLSKKKESDVKTMNETLPQHETEKNSQIVNQAIVLNELKNSKSVTKAQQQDNESRLPTLYELYSHGHVQSGLTVDSREFLLNGKAIRVMSGTIHYFRVHPAYWRDRLKKLRAAGFNTVTTDIPWNFHQPFKSSMDFSSSWRNIRRFIHIAKEEDLFVILRVGPYISSEWDLGGLPHWLLQEDEIKFRTPQTLFFKPVSEYLKTLSKLLIDLQWSKTNGAQPLLAVQLENEFLIVSVMADRDKRYLMSLKNTMVDAGLSDPLYVITNPPNQICKERLVPGIFQAVSFSGDPTFPFFMLSHTQPDMPKLVMTFQAGGFDRFTDNKHHTDDVQEFRTNLEWILSNGSSVNLYMFHGGTTFGFMNGGSRMQRESFYKPGVNSYDYDAPLTESGDYTKKYWAAQALAKAYHVGPKIWSPEPPPETIKKAYPSLQIQKYLSFDDFVSILPNPIPQFNPKPMEFLELHDGSGQGHGFILYRKESVILNPYSVLKINGIIRDIVYVLIDGKLISSPLTSVSNINSAGYWVQRNPQFDISGDGEKHRVDLLVESMGRDNLEMSNGKKGIRGTVMLDDAPLNYWRVYPIEFSNQWIQAIPQWRQFHAGTPITSPGLYKANLKISDIPHDTFLNPFDKRNKWTKGQIFINTFNLGRYWDIGPTQTSYIPAPLLRTGDNEILLFEIYKPGNFITFQDKPSLG